MCVSCTREAKICQDTQNKKKSSASCEKTLLGGSWVIRCRVVSILNRVIGKATALITYLQLPMKLQQAPDYMQLLNPDPTPLNPKP